MSFESLYGVQHEERIRMDEQDESRPDIRKLACFRCHEWDGERCACKDGQTIFHGDCREILPLLPKVDLVLTDPPYGIDACNMTLGTGAKKFTRGDWDRVRPDLSHLMIAGEKHCIWGGNYFTDILPPTNHWLVWHKLNDNLSFSEVEMAWTDYGRQARIKVHHWGREKKEHPTQKPLEVVKWSLAMCEANTILDPFLGSGTTLVAAKLEGRRGIGIEISRDYCEIAAKRLKQNVFDFEGAK